MSTNRCVACGAEIPEGRQVCMACEAGTLPEGIPIGHERRFYAILDNEDGTVDVCLIPDGMVYDAGCGRREYDARLYVVPGVTPWDGMEEDIRARYNDWVRAGRREIP